MTDFCLLYSTFASADEAFSVASSLVEKRLAACANVHGGVRSVYRWQGKVEQAAEAVLVAKTSRGKVDAAIAEVKRLHSYEVPCIIACPIEAGFAPFLQWIADETA